MTVRPRTLLSAGLLFALLLTLSPLAAQAQVMRKDTGNTPTFAPFVSDKLNPPKAIDEIDNLRATLDANVHGAWNRFALDARGPWKGYVDARNGVVEYAEGAGI